MFQSLIFYWYHPLFYKRPWFLIFADQENNKVQVYFIPSNPEILEENSDDVVLSGDVAQETIVVTTTDDESVGDFVESHIVPIGNLDVLNTVELSCDDNFQSSLETSDLG